MSGYFRHESAIVDDPVEIGEGTKVWHFVHICSGAKIGSNCVFGQNSMVAPGVVIGDNVKVQNNVSIYTGTTIEDEVFLGPSCVLTNVTNPRSQVVRRNLYEKTHIRRGATIGANATIVCGITIGRYAFIAAGAVVTKDVSDYAFVMGVPGRASGWMSRHGHRLHFRPLEAGEGELIPGGIEGEIAECPESGFRYILNEGAVRCIDLDEEQPLPANLSTGSRSYDDFKGGVE